MKRFLVFTSAVVGAALVGRRLVPEWRERLSRLPGVLMGRMMAHMPDE